MKKHTPWKLFFLLLLLALSVQGCLGIGDNNTTQNFKQINTGSGKNLGVNTSDQALFKGKIYFTQNHNLFVVDGSRSIKLLKAGSNVYDPAVSPDGKWIACILRYYNYSNLVIIPTNGGPMRTLLNGQGAFLPNGDFAPKSTHNWFWQPTWTADSKAVIFLSDLQKLYDWANYPYGDLGTNFDQAPFLDMQVFSIAINAPPQKAYVENHNIVAYASYGDGGDRDPSLRPGHPFEMIYTHYTYDSTRTRQVVQLFMEDPTMIVKHPERHYHPGDPGVGFDPGIAITPPIPDLANIQPAFSPDGNSIAYIRRIDMTHMGLYVMPVPGNITNDPNNPAVEKRALQLYQKSVQILTGQFVSQPVWSPEGKQIAYISYFNNELDIWLATVSVNPKTGAYSMQGSPIPLTQGGIDGDSRAFWTL